MGEPISTVTATARGTVMRQSRQSYTLTVIGLATIGPHPVAQRRGRPLRHAARAPERTARSPVARQEYLPALIEPQLGARLRI